MRLSDAERNEAIEVLSEHVRTGRLDIDEFGKRSAQASAARTTAELRPLFKDLPEPHPSVLRKAPPAPKDRPQVPVRRFGPGVVPIAAIIALLLFLTVAKTWLVFLLPLVVALAMGSRTK